MKNDDQHGGTMTSETTTQTEINRLHDSMELAEKVRDKARDALLTAITITVNYETLFHRITGYRTAEKSYDEARGKWLDACDAARRASR